MNVKINLFDYSIKLKENFQRMTEFPVSFGVSLPVLQRAKKRGLTKSPSLRLKPDTEIGRMALRNLFISTYRRTNIANVAKKIVNILLMFSQ